MDLIAQVNIDFDFDPKSPRLKLIAGDASDRKFYRYQTAELSCICMQFPSWQGGYGGDPLSWLGMHEAFKVWKIPLPEVLWVDEKNACIWTSDLGDSFLNRDFGAHPVDMAKPECAQAMNQYKQALRLLLMAQYPEQNSEIKHPASSRFFDADKLMYELNFFAQHFLTSLLGFKEIGSGLLNEWQDLAQQIAQRERVVCHRDYHARNLMIQDNKVYWIDFQDARMGPHAYDVVSLLRDSYVRFEPKTREALFDFYYDELCALRGRARSGSLSAAEFYKERLMVGLQRNIKALGSFAYLCTVKKKKVYLSYVTHTLETILKDSAASEISLQFPKTFELLERMLHGDLRKHFLKIVERENIDQF